MKANLFTLVLVTLTIGCNSQNKTFKSISENEESIYLTERDSSLIDSIFTDYSGNRPGAAVLIAKGDKLVYCKSYGLIDMEKNVAVSCDTKFHLASASKQFTAMAILKLIDEDKLSFDTNLQQIFPKFPDYGKHITIQHLLTHQSGLVEINTSSGDPIGFLMKDRDRLNRLMQMDSISFPAGTKLKYSNTAFSVLAEIVSELSGLSFDEYMQIEIFSKVGMNATSYYPNNIQRNIGYRILQDSIIKAKGASDATMGSGTVYTTANDYFKWHLALSNNKLISSHLHDLAYKAQEGTRNKWGHYGYGWAVAKNEKFDFVEHGGITQSAGFMSFTARIPDEKITVAIFTNRAWSKANLPSQNIGNRAKVLLSIATGREFPMLPIKDIDPKPKKSLAQVLIDEILVNGIDSGIDMFQDLKDSDLYYVNEAELNNVGYALINIENNRAALEVFQLNAKLFPESWNVYDSLGELFLKIGDKEQAIDNYSKSLKINPENDNAKKILAKMKF